MLSLGNCTLYIERAKIGKYYIFLTIYLSLVAEWYISYADWLCGRTEMKTESSFENSVWLCKASDNLAHLVVLLLHTL